MNCEEVEVELSGGTLSAAAQVHVAQCASCDSTRRMLDLATLPPLTDGEKLALGGLAVSTQRVLYTRRTASETRWRLASLALAAGLGALIATGFLNARHVSLEATETAEVFAIDSDEANLFEDEVFFDVGWPSPAEGDP